MVTSQNQVESQAIELSAEAFNAFCDDISGMFDVDMKCNQQQVSTETVAGLKKRFKKLVAVNSVKAEGALNGTFQLVFDHEGLFTLAGVIVMLPEQRILNNRKRGSAKDAEDMNDAVSEAGNMLVGSWDRVFREELDGHGHFVQTNTFLGNPWDKPEEKIGLAGDEEFVFVPYEMTIEPYPAFKCGVIFPKTIFEPASQSDTEQTVPAEKEETQEPEAAVEKTDSEESDAGQKDDIEEPKQQEPTTEEPPVEEAIAEEKTEETVKAESDNVDENVPDEVVNEKAATTPETAQPKESDADKVSETIQKMTKSPAKLPGESDLPATTEATVDSISVSLAVSAKDIMRKEIIWGEPDDSVQQALTKMQQHNVGYIMVGKNGVLEGIVSKSDVTAAVSVYLKPVFAKWRQPLDDATLQIRIKWIMSKPVHTIGQDTSLATIMENMCQFGLRALGVLDEQGKVNGIVTVFDVFKALLKCNPNIPAASQKQEVPSN